MCLSIDGIPVLEGKGHSTVCVDGGVVQKPQPEAVGELGELSVLRFQELQEVLHLRLPGLLVAELLGGCFVLFFGSFEAAVQGIKAFLVFRLVKGYGGVFPDASLHHLGDDFHLAAVFVLLCGKLGRIEDRGLRFFECFYGFFPAG